MKLSKDLRNFIADSLERYVNLREQCLISEIDPETLDRQLKKSRKLISKIRKGDMNVFNEKMLEKKLPDLERARKEYNSTRY